MTFRLFFARSAEIALVSQIGSGGDSNLIEVRSLIRSVNFDVTTSNLTERIKDLTLTRTVATVYCVRQDLRLMAIGTNFEKKKCKKNS